MRIPKISAESGDSFHAPLALVAILSTPAWAQRFLGIVRVDKGYELQVSSMDNSLVRLQQLEFGEFHR
jgi:hypothetical protein